MRETDNFNLTIPEGSDNVNILTQITPNFETIDEVMKNNENAGVQVATVLYSNNIHAITRTKDYASVMRFTATSRFTLGDTFTVDGVQVSALAPTGEQLPDGAFIVGSEVLAILKGTLLTVFAGAKASDSAKLNGQSASFYATKAEVDNAQTLAEGSATIAQEALDNIPTSSETTLKSGIVLKRYGKVRVLNIRGARGSDVISTVIPSGDRPNSASTSTINYYNYIADISVETNGTITMSALTQYGADAWTQINQSSGGTTYGQIVWVTP